MRIRIQARDKVYLDPDPGLGGEKLNTKNI